MKYYKIGELYYRVSDAKVEIASQKTWWSETNTRTPTEFTSKLNRFFLWLFMRNYLPIEVPFEEVKNIPNTIRGCL